ncbi:MAG: hypothetical protein AAFV90_16215 [Cyanobacteria bacterium J06634_5]
MSPTPFSLGRRVGDEDSRKWDAPTFYPQRPFGNLTERALGLLLLLAAKGVRHWHYS